MRALLLGALLVAGCRQEYTLTPRAFDRFERNLRTAVRAHNVSEHRDVWLRASELGDIRIDGTGTAHSTARKRSHTSIVFWVLTGLSLGVVAGGGVLLDRGLHAPPEDCAHRLFCNQERDLDVGIGLGMVTVNSLMAIICGTYAIVFRNHNDAELEPRVPGIHYVE